MHDEMQVVEVTGGSNSSSQIGKDLEIPSNLHGEWLVVTRKPRFHNRGDSKGKGKAAVNDLNAKQIG